jgi:DNA-binding NarL/FixJ family response regulator
VAFVGEAAISDAAEGVCSDPRGERVSEDQPLQKSSMAVGLWVLKGGNIMMSGEIRVFIVDDDYYMRQALLALLWKESEIKVVGMASCPEELIYLVSNGDIQEEADVILLDMKYIGDEMTGVNAIEEIRDEVPGAKIVILSMLRQVDLVLEAVRAGADGYLWKMEVADKVADAIRKVHHGHFVVTPFR